MNAINITSDFLGANSYGGAYAVIDGKRVSFNSVRGYTIYGMNLWHRDGYAKVEAEAHRKGMTTAAYIEAHVQEREEEARKRGHRLFWVSLSPTVIHNGPRDTTYDDVPQLKTGDTVCFDGRLFTIKGAPNGNFELV